MSRQPYGMKTLIEEVSALHEDADHVQLLDRDGFGVYRTVAFDEHTSEKLKDVISALDSDSRIASHEVEEDGRLNVFFVSDHRADSRAPFNLAAAHRVLNPPDERGEREKELKATPVADLREQYPDYNDYKKPDLIAAVLVDEFGP